jgi:hypothetical protein
MTGALLEDQQNYCPWVAESSADDIRVSSVQNGWQRPARLIFHSEIEATGGWGMNAPFLEMLYAPRTTAPIRVLSQGSSNISDLEQAIMIDTRREEEQRDQEIARLLRVYVFEDADLVRRFLSHHRTAGEFLLEGAAALREFFTDVPELQLQVIPDENGIGTIYGVVIWRDSVATAREALRKFDQAWWSEHAERAAGKIAFDYQLA